MSLDPGYGWPRRWMRVDPRQTPTELMEPAMEAGQPSYARPADFPDLPEGPAPGAVPVLPVPVTRVEIMTLTEGDRLIVHVDGAAGISAGGGEKMARKIRAALRLDDLPFDVPVLIVAPGIEVQIGRAG